MAEQREQRFERRMSDAEALMWNVEKDPWLNPNGASVTILDRPLDMDLFRARVANAVVQVPRRIKRDMLDVAPLLVEVDTYCRSGDLLTLTPPEEVRAFWIWFLLEFVRQADGEPPLSWLTFAEQQ